LAHTTPRPGSGNAPSMRPRTTARGWLAALATAFAATAVATPALAATYSVKINAALDIGTVAAAATGDTVFVIDPSNGAVTQSSGGGRRTTSGAVQISVTISCKPSRGGDLTCDSDNVNVTVGTAGTNVGRARSLTNFTVAMSTATLVSGPTTGAPISFTIQPIGTNSNKTFFVGATFPVAGDDSGLASGNGTNGLSVSVVNGVGATLAADSNQGKVKALRTLTLSKSSELQFGMVGRPTGNTGSVSVNATSGARTVSGTGSISYPSPTPTAANFSVNGEGGQVFSVSLPATITLAGPGGATLTVTTTKTVGGTASLNGTLGGAGTKAIGVGGSFPMNKDTVLGAYTGVFALTVDYN
jgi:hypothetical protein